MSQHTVYRTPLHMWLHTIRLVRVPSPQSTIKSFYHGHKWTAGLHAHRTVSTRMHCWKKKSRGSERDTLGEVPLGNPTFGHSCGRHLDTCHLPKHYCSQVDSFKVTLFSDGSGFFQNVHRYTAHIVQEWFEEQ